MEFGDFDDDLFESETKPDRFRKEAKFDEAIRAYAPRQVTPLKFLTEEVSKEIDDLANLNKMRADYYYFNGEYAKALDLYQASLDLSVKSQALNNTIFQKELADSMAKCLCHLGRTHEALEIITKLEEQAVNFELYSSAQFLRLKVIEHDLSKIDNNSNELTTSDDLLHILCRIITLHPCYSAIWIKLCDCLWSRMTNRDDRPVKFATVCYSITKIVIKNAALARDKEVGAKRTSLEAHWLKEKEAALNAQVIILDNELMQKIDSTSGIFERLESADKTDEVEKIGQARRLVEPVWFLETWLAGKY